jgi:hypothetical protein
MATAISLAEAPKPLSIETLAIQAIETRPKLQAAIEEEKHRLEEAELKVARTFASQTQAGGNVDVEQALQSSKASKESEEQIKQRTGALEYLQEKLNKHLDQLKVNHPGAVGAALDLRVGALEAIRLEKETAGKGIAEEIKNLKAERSKLPKGAAKKAAADN